MNREKVRRRRDQLVAVLPVCLYAVDKFPVLTVTGMFKWEPLFPAPS